jgi:hypothetical protein
METTSPLAGRALFSSVGKGNAMAALPCPQCGQPMQTDGQPSAASACPACSSRSSLAPANERSALCAICQSPFGPADERTDCPGCSAPYHADCWQENGGCAVYGCSQVPQAEPRRSVEIPVSFWGQENKPCPACGREILAAAIRCRHCGATFASAQPEDAEAFQRRTAREQRIPQLQRLIVVLFILSVLPCLAPLGGVWGLIWYPIHRSDIELLPPLYPALCKIGVFVGLGQTVLIVIMGILYATLRGS